jgi:vitamin B12 transporter
MKLPAGLLLLGVTAIAGASEETTIVITPTGNETPIGQAPGSVTVVTAQEIASRSYGSVAEALETVPGISVVRSGPRGQITSLFARGANSNHTLVMRDGMVLNDPSSPTGAYDFSSMSLDGVERIEIVRGPLSTLYGSSAIGAVINIISKSGTLVPRHAVSLAAGSDRRIESSLSTSGSSGRLRYYFSLSYDRSDGQTAVMQKPGYGNTGQAVEDDGFENAGFSTRLSWYLNDDTRLELTGFVQHARTEIDEWTLEDSDWELGNREQGAQLQLMHRPAGGDWGMQLSLRLNRADRWSRNPRQSPTENLIDTSYLGEHAGLEGRFNYYGIDRHELSLIAGYREDSLTTSGFSAYGSPFGDFVVTENTDASVSSLNLALQDQWTGAAGESLTGSVRLEQNEDFGSHLTWRLAGSVPFAQRRGRLHLSAGTGFRAPSLYELYGDSPNNYGSAYSGNPDLQPETSRTLEAGMDYDFREHGLTAGVTLYTTTIEDLIETLYDPLFNSTSMNLARAEISGGELYLKWKATEKLGLGLDYSYTDARDADSGARLLRRPYHKIDATLDYELSERATLWAEVHYVGNRVDINPALVNYPSAPQRIRPGDYLLLHVGASYDLDDDTRLFGRINNLADESYEPVAGYRGEGINGIVGFTMTL